MTGSLKFDSLDLPSTALQARSRDRVLRYFRVSSSRPVIVAGSTMKGEEAAVLRAFRRVRAANPTTLLVLAPRNPERFGEVEQQCRVEGWKVAKRSDLAIDSEPRVDIVVLDTIGELATVYQSGDRRSWGEPRGDGGHNVLEPAISGSQSCSARMENSVAVRDQRSRMASATRLEACCGDRFMRACVRRRTGRRLRRQRSVTVLADLLPGVSPPFPRTSGPSDPGDSIYGG